MSQTFKYYVPAIGSKGFYELNSPFVTTPGQVYTCIAVRSLSDYVANNDDALTDIYKANSLTEDDYLADLTENMEVVSLRNDSGFVLQVPAKYIAQYPTQDGVFYRGLAITIALPAMPVDQDTTFVLDDLRSLITSDLGVNCVITPVQTSAIKLVSQADHQSTQTNRQMVIGDQSTLYGQLAAKQAEIESLTARLRVVEQYVIDHPPAP